MTTIWVVRNRKTGRILSVGLLKKEAICRYYDRFDDLTVDLYVTPEDWKKMFSVEKLKVR